MDEDSNSIRAYPGFMLSVLEQLQMEAQENDVDIQISVVVVFGTERSGTSTSFVHGIIGAFGDAVVHYEPHVYRWNEGVEVSGVLLSDSEPGHKILVMEFHRLICMRDPMDEAELQILQLAHTLLTDASIFIANMHGCRDRIMHHYLSNIYQSINEPAMRTVSGHLIWLSRGAPQVTMIESLSDSDEEQG